MGDFLIPKALACRNRIAELRAAIPASPADVLASKQLEAFLAFNLFLLIQDSIDIAAHLVAERTLGTPGSQRETFELLARAEVLEPATARALAAMASLRNRIARAYGEIDSERMVSEMPAGLDVIATFIDEITRATSES